MTSGRRHTTITCNRPRRVGAQPLVSVIQRDPIMGLPGRSGRCVPTDLSAGLPVPAWPRILLEEWAYIRDWHSDAERSDHYGHFVHFYNHHRAHGALGWSTPMSTLKDNVSGHHS